MTPAYTWILLALAVLLAPVPSVAVVRLSRLRATLRVDAVAPAPDRRATTSPARAVALGGGCGAALGAVVAVLGQPAVRTVSLLAGTTTTAASVAAVGVVVGRGWAARTARKWEERCTVQLANALTSLTAELQAGQTPAAAFR